MPLTAKGRKIMAALVEQYGEEKAKRVFYAGKNSGRFTGVDSSIQLTEVVILDQVHFKKTADGYLVAQPRVARTGIQLYSPKEVGKNFDRMVKVYRPEEEVFSQDTIKSFAHRPVTLNHPPEMVNDANWKKYAKGHTIDPIVRDGEFVRVPIMLMDQETIKEFESGRNQLSMGYTCDLRWEPGTTDDGEEYDAVQCNLRMNHLALVHNARGGDQLRIGDDDTDDNDDNDETTDQDLVHCPNCDAEIPDDAEVCDVCGYEMQDGDVRENALGDDLHEDFYAEDYNENHDPRTGQFASSGGSGGGGTTRTRTKKPSATSRQEELKQHGYTFGNVFAKGGGSKHWAAHPASGYHTGAIFANREAAVVHAEEHATVAGRISTPEAAAPPYTPGPLPAGVVKGVVDPLTGYPTTVGAPLARRPEVATAAAVGVPAPTTSAPALVKRPVGRPRKYLRPGDPGYVASERASEAPGARATRSGEPGFAAGRTTFTTRSEARQHIRMQRRRWRWARPVLHAPRYVARRGFGFTGAKVPGLRRQVGSPYYTLHHDSLEPSWTIVFDEELDALPLTDTELTEVLDYNPNHDPQTGEFTSSESSSLGASLLTSASRREAASATFSSPAAAKQQAAMQIATWKRHLASQEEALREIKKNIALWEKAKIRPHVEYETKQRFLLGEKRTPVRTHYTVHVDSFDFLDAIQVTEVDLLQAQEWDQQQEIINSSVPAMDEIAEEAHPTGDNR